MNKAAIRSSLATDIEAFLQSGGRIHVLDREVVEVKNTAACRYRRGVGAKARATQGIEPKPVTSWFGKVFGDQVLNITGQKESFFQNKR
jgi:hypothetical protein